MTERVFQLRLQCRYERPDNTPVALSVQYWGGGVWNDLVLNFEQPGFLIFVYAILICQHLYLRANAAELGLLLTSAVGSVVVAVDHDWVMRKLEVSFEARLASGSPAPDAVAHIVDRMQHCPVSVNLQLPRDSRTLLQLVAPEQSDG